MKIEEIVKSAIKLGKATIGYKESLKLMKIGSPKMVIVSKTAPEKIRKEIEDVAKALNIKIEIYNGSSRDLGMICGKPFPVTTVAIKD